MASKSLGKIFEAQKIQAQRADINNLKTNNLKNTEIINNQQKEISLDEVNKFFENSLKYYDKNVSKQNITLKDDKIIPNIIQRSKLDPNLLLINTFECILKNVKITRKSNGIDDNHNAFFLTFDKNQLITLDIFSTIIEDDDKHNFIETKISLDNAINCVNKYLNQCCGTIIGKNGDIVPVKFNNTSNICDKNQTQMTLKLLPDNDSLKSVIQTQLANKIILNNETFTVAFNKNYYNSDPTQALLITGISLLVVVSVVSIATGKGAGIGAAGLKKAKAATAKLTFSNAVAAVSLAGKIVERSCDAADRAFEMADKAKDYYSRMRDYQERFSSITAAANNFTQKCTEINDNGIQMALPSNMLNYVDDAFGMNLINQHISTNGITKPTFQSAVERSIIDLEDYTKLNLSNPFGNRTRPNQNRNPINDRCDEHYRRVRRNNNDNYFGTHIVDETYEENYVEAAYTDFIERNPKTQPRKFRFEENPLIEFNYNNSIQFNTNCTCNVQYNKPEDVYPPGEGITSILGPLSELHRQYYSYIIRHANPRGKTGGNFGHRTDGTPYHQIDGKFLMEQLKAMFFGTNRFHHRRGGDNNGRDPLYNAYTAVCLSNRDDPLYHRGEGIQVYNQLLGWFRAVDDRDVTPTTLIKIQFARTLFINSGLTPHSWIFYEYIRELLRYLESSLCKLCNLSRDPYDNNNANYKMNTDANNRNFVNLFMPNSNELKELYDSVTNNDQETRRKHFNIIDNDLGIQMHKAHLSISLEFARELFLTLYAMSCHFPNTNGNSTLYNQRVNDVSKYIITLYSTLASLIQMVDDAEIN